MIKRARSDLERRERMRTMTDTATEVRARILVVDDERSVRRLIRLYLEAEGAEILEAGGAAEATSILEYESVDLVVADVHIPGGSGLGLLHVIRERWENLPVIVITGSHDPDPAIAALNGGASGYLLKPFERDELLHRVRDALEQRLRQERLERERAELERQVRRQRDEVQSLVLRGVRALVEAVEAKDAYTRGHSARVTGYALILAEAMGVDPEPIRLGGELHDIGKIGVPDAILNKPGPLDAEEWAKLREHPLIGIRILEPLIRDEKVISMALCHHERWDGKGYPHGLHGCEIPIEARILSVADTLDAITSVRAYRPARTWEYAVAEIRRESGKQFAPAVVDAAESVLDRLEAHYRGVFQGA